ncbi:thiol-disulfide isomerase [Sphingomonas sp. DBB INV C78]|uniref:TlpA family protein disulfide reductase n=1 Tax=Sphingomonas sp. DBB INV C78 TaxID=3349434 RepID=UPI0036D2EBE7
MRLLMVLILALTLGACDKEKSQPPQADVKEPIGRVDISHAGTEAPAIPFEGPKGGPATLASFRGKPLIVNLWATWCAPCVREMPTLDALAEREKGRIQLIVVSMDMAGQREVGPYFAKAKFKALEPYIDKQNVLMEALKTDTLPTTIFYDAKGREQWRVLGAMDWSGDRAKTLIENAINPPGVS